MTNFILERRNPHASALIGRSKIGQLLTRLFETRITPQPCKDETRMKPSARSGDSRHRNRKINVRLRFSPALRIRAPPSTLNHRSARKRIRQNARDSAQNAVDVDLTAKKVSLGIEVIPPVAFTQDGDIVCAGRHLLL